MPEKMDSNKGKETSSNKMDTKNLLLLLKNREERQSGSQKNAT